MIGHHRGRRRGSGSRAATRVEFVCGGRALRSHRHAARRASPRPRACSRCRPPELAGAIERHARRGQGRRRGRSAQLQEEVAAHRAAALRAEAETIGPLRGVLREVPGWDAGALKTLAAAIVSEPGPGRGARRRAAVRSPVVIARSADVAFDAGAWMRRGDGGARRPRRRTARAGARRRCRGPAGRIRSAARRAIEARPRE